MYDAVLNKQYHEKKKKGVSIKVFLSVLIIFTILLVTITTYGSKPVNYNTITIKKGDTLWSIVNQFNTDNMDPRKMISAIKELNKMEDVILQPGQKIIIPEY